ncbi:DEAD/DEAH box helicase [Bacillus horti]|uniref:Superfamily II DNA or RNA helicase/L-rhamnose mutarotase n=1 Tax=Caldalkalibacillus horti TaxID=77523 RepID=A0ABT9VVG1_9BACI|nr:DEAD/DEAH box helicase [Bacillus horti]MDQ0164971.1 superfamily II DNA or RNA helicase/L-rhamnose mutarotase [Bacillus horti]
MFKIDLEAIHPIEIENMCTNARTYKRGESYFFNENVKQIKFHQAERKATAIVEGEESYRSTILFNTLGEVKKYSCTCEAYGTYPGACKHIAATMLEIYERYSHQAFQQKGQEPAHPMIESFKESFRAQPKVIKETKERLHIHFELNFQESPYQRIVEQVEIRIKAGIHRPYFVKNLDDFLYALDQELTYPLTPKFEFDPDDHFVEEQDLYILQQFLKLQGIKRTSYNGRRMFFEEEPKDDRFIVPDVLFPEVLTLLESASHVSYKNKFDRTLPLLITELEKHDITFDIEPSTEGKTVYLKLANIAEYTFFLKEHRVVLYGEHLIRLNEEQAHIMEMLFAEAESEEYMAKLSHPQLEEFCSYVLPKLEQVGRVQMKEEVTSLIQQYPLKARLELDLNGGLLTGQLFFQYGEESWNPLSVVAMEPRETVLRRDLEKEETLLALMSQTAFIEEDDVYVAEGEEQMIEVLFEDLLQIGKYADIYSTVAVQRMMTIIEVPPSIHLSTNDQMNWLDLSFSIEGIPEEDVDSVLNAIRQNRRVYRLSTGSFVHLENDVFQGVKEALRQLAPEKGNVSRRMSVPLYKAVALEEVAAQRFKLSESLKQLIEQLRQPETIEYEVPKKVQAELRPYQQTGFRWLRALSQFGLGGILADDMGLGKTLQAITFLQSLYEEKPSLRALVLAPASLLYNWKKELERFAPSLQTCVIAGTKIEREQLMQDHQRAQVWITSYPLIQRDEVMFEGEVFDALILDEAQATKNEASKTTKAVRSLRASSIFALSGTPVENRLEELYSIFQTIMPGLLGSKKSFRGLERQEIAKRVRPFILRRMKKEVLQELPDKIEQVQYTDLTDEQKMLYLAQVKSLAKEVDQAAAENRFQERRMHILAGLTKLRQICCHPQLILPDESYASGKFERLLELVQEGLDADHRIVIFSQFTSMLSLIRREFDEQGLPYHYLDGSTPSEQRVELAERFNNGEHSLFLVSMKAGGTGLNLTGGDTVILFDTWWNPAVEQQAADRVYRYGQKKTVQVVKLITTGTIEEKMLALHEKKKALVEEIIQPGEQSLSSLKLEDIKELLKV